MFVFQLIKDIFREFCVFCARQKKGRGRGGHGALCPQEVAWRLLHHQRIYVGIELGGLTDDGFEDTAFGIEDNLSGITLDGIAG